MQKYFGGVALVSTALNVVTGQTRHAFGCPPQRAGAPCNGTLNRLRVSNEYRSDKTRLGEEAPQVPIGDEVIGGKPWPARVAAIAQADKCPQSSKGRRTVQAKNTPGTTKPSRVGELDITLSLTQHRMLFREG
jgi:hypothetical protein